MAQWLRGHRQTQGLRKHIAPNQCRLGIATQRLTIAACMQHAAAVGQASQAATLEIKTESTLHNSSRTWISLVIHPSPLLLCYQGTSLMPHTKHAPTDLQLHNTCYTLSIAPQYVSLDSFAGCAHLHVCARHSCMCAYCSAIGCMRCAQLLPSKASTYQAA